MKECDIFSGQNILRVSDPSYIFSGEDPQEKKKKKHLFFAKSTKQNE